MSPFDTCQERLRKIFGLVAITAMHLTTVRKSEMFPTMFDEKFNDSRKNSRARCFEELRASLIQ